MKTPVSGVYRVCTGFWRLNAPLLSSSMNYYNRNKIVIRLFPFVTHLNYLRYHFTLYIQKALRFPFDFVDKAIAINVKFSMSTLVKIEPIFHQIVDFEHWYRVCDISARSSNNTAARIKDQSSYYFDIRFTL